MASWKWKSQVSGGSRFTAHCTDLTVTQCTHFSCYICIGTAIFAILTFYNCDLISQGFLFWYPRESGSSQVGDSWSCQDLTQLPPTIYSIKHIWYAQCSQKGDWLSDSAVGLGTRFGTQCTDPTGFQSHQSWVTVGVSVVCAGVRLFLLCDMNHFWHLGRSLEKLVGQLCHSQGIQDLLGTYIYDWWLHFGHKVKYFSCYDWSLVSCAGRSVSCNVVLPIA